MRRSADGEAARPAHGDVAGTSWSEPFDSPRTIGLARDDDGQGALEIEFEDDEAAAPSSRAARSRDLRPAALTTLAATLLGAALWATHGLATPAAVAGPPETPPVARDYAAFVVTVAYQGSHLLSAAQRRIEVDLRVTPVPGANVRIIAYYISENGVSTHADPPPSGIALPAGGTDVRLDLTVTDCATVPIGESMGFVDVIADGPTGVTDRFTILGERYATDLAGLLRRLCPGRPNGQGRSTIGVVVAGS